MNTSSTSTTDAAELRDFAIEAAQLLKDLRCEAVQLLDVRGLSQVCDYVLIANGTSDKQMKSVAAELKDLGEQRKQPIFRSHGDAGTTWIVVDFVDLVVHLFEPEQRAYYAIEQLWSDSKLVHWERDEAE